MPRIAGILFVAILALPGGAQDGKDPKVPLKVADDRVSGLVRAEDAVPTRGEWGEWHRYFRGDTHGTKDMVVLEVTLKPGQAPHPPHRHAEEEFMILADGSGTWTLDAKEIAAKKGDVVYAAPWTMHGLKNAGDGPLTYYMVKWNNKSVPPPAMAAAEPKSEPDKPAVVKDRVKGSISHDREKAEWNRLSGRVKVLDARTLEFADGTQVALGLNAPESGQQGLIDGRLYPCDKEAADFLRKLIGDQPVICIRDLDDDVCIGCYVGDVNIKHAMVINGWALASHSSLHPAEIIARENKRGLWRGQFVTPAEWRAGKRLPGEK
jgi:endonuclease YncB( thermonuclease family)/quercetin dioxygenase-like cupin family protein